ncbi:MAG TPA: TetR family transcriptional regulator [Streptosporangiaceae bacterium]
MAIDLVRMALARDPATGADPVTERILDAALGQFEDFGLRRSTMEDIARRCGLSRITIYRRFPKKENLVEAVVLRELHSFLGDLVTVGGDDISPADRIIERVAFALHYLRGHSLLRRLLRTEPEAILPSLTVNGGPVVDMAREHSAAFIRRDLFGGATPPPEVERRIQTVAELGVRIVLSFILTPSSAIPMNTLDEARAFARELIAPVQASVLSEMTQEPQASS